MAATTMRADTIPIMIYVNELSLGTCSQLSSEVWANETSSPRRISYFCWGGIRSPFTYVPFVLWSKMYYLPKSPTSTKAWWRLTTSVLSLMWMSQDSSRPMVNTLFISLGYLIIRFFLGCFGCTFACILTIGNNRGRLLGCQFIHLIHQVYVEPDAKE